MRLAVIQMLCHVHTYTRLLTSTCKNVNKQPPGRQGQIDLYYMIMQTTDVILMQVW